MFVDIPATSRSSLGIYSKHYTLTAEFLCCFTNQLRTVYCSRIHRNLICTLPEKLLKIIHGTNSSANRKWNKYTGSYFTHHINYRITFFTGCCDIQENQLICSCCIICFCNLNRITGIFQVHKINALNHPAFIDIQTGNDSLGKHISSPPFPVSQNFPES